MFVDYVKINVQAGDGGDGCISFRREKYVPLGGPDGGDGGRGGHIYLQVDPGVTTLLDVRMRPQYIAKRGEHGGGNQCTGRDAEDIIIRVPQGTVVSTEDGEIVADLVEPGQLWMAAKAGRGGRGNQHFATPNNKAPRRWEYGGDGEHKVLILELKMIADIGLVGLPNAGKSTLLAGLTKAQPKVASYPFTTIHPNRGVLELDDDTRCVIADIPGLIEGAHHGAGLGHRFLRHVERTGFLVHLVAPADDVENADFEHFWYSYELVNAELAAYSDTLAGKDQVVCLTKADLMPAENQDQIKAEFAERGVKAIWISALSGQGMGELVDAMKLHLKQLRDAIAAEEKAAEEDIWGDS
jgi:GTP-binding protein